MRTVDKKTSAKDTPHSLILLRKTSGDGVCVDRVDHIFCGVYRDFFFYFKNMTGKGTITNSGGKNNLIQKL
jgi:hypothetical protein